MMNRPTTYLTKEELQEIAAAKFQEAATLPPGYQKDDSEVGREFPSSRRNERLVIQRIASAEAKHF
jgi:hypothetical protein